MKGCKEKDITLKDIIVLTKELPEKYFAEVYEKLTEIKEKAEEEKRLKRKQSIVRIANRG